VALLKLLKGMATSKDGAVAAALPQKTAGKGPVAASKKGIAAAIDGDVAAKDGWQWCC
jgi:hypothetical protein